MFSSFTLHSPLSTLPLPLPLPLRATPSPESIKGSARSQLIYWRYWRQTSTRSGGKNTSPTVRPRPGVGWARMRSRVYSALVVAPLCIWLYILGASRRESCGLYSRVTAFIVVCSVYTQSNCSTVLGFVGTVN